MNRPVFAALGFLLVSVGTTGCQNTPTRTSARPPSRSSVVRAETDELTAERPTLLNIGAPTKSKPVVDLIDVPMIDH